MNMGTNIRPEISEQKEYWIGKHRYYELKHFCMQYPEWKNMHNSLDGLSKQPTDLIGFSKKYDISDPTGKCVELRAYCLERMKLIEEAANKADKELANYILKGVTEGWSYDIIKLRLEIPCCKDTYYDRYRRFFWILSNKRK